MISSQNHTASPIIETGFSVICCSVCPEQAAALVGNVEASIGAVPFETVVFDNRNEGYGLGRVYNLCAVKARYPYLCFVHEDVRFVTDNWGEKIAAALERNDCGAVGFAGGTLRLPNQLSMCVGRNDRRTHFCRGDKPKIHGRNPEGGEFSEVVTLDGMCLFVRRELWASVLFDEELCPRFHGYDMDLTLAIAAEGYRNMVCNTVLVRHYSDGSFTPEWFDTMRRINDKWSGILPLSIYPLGRCRLARLEHKAEKMIERIEKREKR